MKKLHTDVWGKSLRGRVAFRKLKQREPSEDEAKHCVSSNVSAEDIHTAFEKGEEVGMDFLMTHINTNKSLRKYTFGR